MFPRTRLITAIFVKIRYWLGVKKPRVCSRREKSWLRLFPLRLVSSVVSFMLYTARSASAIAAVRYLKKRKKRKHKNRILGTRQLYTSYMVQTGAFRLDFADTLRARRRTLSLAALRLMDGSAASSSLSSEDDDESSTSCSDHCCLSSLSSLVYKIGFPWAKLHYPIQWTSSTSGQILRRRTSRSCIPWITVHPRIPGIHIVISYLTASSGQDDGPLSILNTQASMSQKIDKPAFYGGCQASSLGNSRKMDDS
ncbi:hypothetical protein F5887DRAFT_978192 [Amanita rubescens]|nr:hypothetical protein F5887DRAFT_978192 [Amanita rubescens]